MKNTLKKFMAIVLGAVLVLSLGLSSFALLDKYDGDTTRELTTDQKRILNRIESQAKEDAKKAGEFGEFESRLYDREFDSGSTIKSTTPAATTTTKAQTTTTTTTKTAATKTTTASVEKYFEKYFNNTVVAIPMSSTLKLADKNIDNMSASDIADLDFNVMKIAKMDVAKIYYYFYDVASNKYYPLLDSSKVDLNAGNNAIEKEVYSQVIGGDLLNIDEANLMKGYIIMSNGALVSK